MNASWQEYLDKNKNYHDSQLEYHLAHSDVSIADYSRQSRFELGAKVCSKLRIYLDQKYWIYCRDAKHGQPQKEIHNEILETLEQLVSSGKVICPASFTVLCETLKHRNPQLRSLTASLIDSLSCGVALQPFFEIIKIELLHLIQTLLQGETQVYPLEQAIWIHAGFVCGEMVPTNTPFDPSTELALQKTMYDITSSMPFSTIVECFPPQEMPSTLFFSNLEAKIDAQSRQHRNDFKTFDEAFMIEVAGFLDCLKPLLGEAIVYLYESMMGNSIEGSEALTHNQGARLLSNVIYHAYRLKRLSSQFPSLHIFCSVHAAIRYQERRYRAGDLYDHEHAVEALPYCDLFLTERALGNLLVNQPLQLDNMYCCRVFWDDEKILTELKKLEMNS